MIGTYGSMVGIVLEKTHAHPEVTVQTVYALGSILDCQIEICKALKVPLENIPAPMTPLSDAWIGDLCNLAEIEVAERAKLDQEAPS